MADTWEYECPQFVDFTSTLSDHEDNDSWFEVDHEAELPAENVETFQITSSKNSSNILDTAPVIVTISQSNMTIDPPKDTVKEEAKDVKEVTIKSDSRSPLNNMSNVLTKEEFYMNKKNKNFGKLQACVPGKENTNKKGPGRVPRKSTSTVLMTDRNEDVAILQKNHEQQKESKPTFTRPLPQQCQHRRSLSTGNLNLNKSSEMHQNISHHLIKNNTLQKFNNSEKLNHGLSVSMEKLNPRRSVSAEKINSERLCYSRTNSASSLNSEKSSGTLSKPSGVSKIRYNTLPSANRATNSNNKQLTSAELELQKIEEKRQEALAVKKLAEESFKNSLKSKGYVPVNSNCKPTVAKGFEFRTDKRLRTRSADFVKSPVTDLSRILRKDNSIQYNKPPRKTVVQPFKLSENKKMEAPVQKFQTVAEQVRNFSKKTPERFRAHSKGNKPQNSWSQPRCTIPKTPNFTCQQRSRPVNILSTKEIEEKEFEEIQKYKFKAKEVDRKIFQTRTGIKKIPKKEVTIPVPFDLPGCKLPIYKKEVEEEHFVFHARPLPTDILERVVGVKAAELIPPTVPESPAFALRQRIQRFTVNVLKQETQIRKIRARPYVHSGVNFEPKFEHRSTVAEPFSFDDRIKENQIKKEQKIQKLIDESTKVAEFSANPIPDYTNTGIPPKRISTVTKFAPFKLHIEERVEKRIEEKQQQLEEKLKLQEEKMQFKAQSCEVVKKAPFVPHLDHKCTQEHTKFKLYTEARHAQRVQFEEQKKAREAELLVMRLEAEKLCQEEEDREIQRQRQEAVHKANPIKHYKPVEIQHKSLSVTIPLEPKFATKSRVRTNDNYEK